jgi:hypothetical protein
MLMIAHRFGAMIRGARRSIPHAIASPACAGARALAQRLRQQLE